MRSALFIFFWALTASLPAHAREKKSLKSIPPFHDLELQSTTVTSPDPLKPEDFASIDPGVTNPHLERWALGRMVELQGLGPRILPQGAFGVMATGLDARSVIHLREGGPWYQSLKQFPCSSKGPKPEYSTQEGARALAGGAARVWEDLLVDRKLKLTVELSRIASPSEASALEKARRVFKEWLALTDQEWRERLATDLVPKQWKTYRREAQASGFCETKATANVSQDVWPDTWMPLSQSSPAVVSQSAREAPPQPLFRAPAKRVGGYYTVHLDVRVGDRSVSGQFLVDPSSPESVISPTWLIAQGVQPVWVEIPEAMPTHVRVKAGDGATGLAKMAFFDDVTTSGFSLPVHRFQVFDVSSIFDEPASPEPCCSGVLGQDFLSRYVVEFHPEEPMEMLIWKVDGPRWSDERLWVELRRVPAPGQPLGVYDFITACSPRIQALGLPKLCESPVDVMRNSVGTLVFDVPHGKLWFSKKELEAPIYRNRSGLELKYGYLNKNRALLVKSIAKTGAVRELVREGLREGDRILEVDGIPSAQMGIWDVNQRLSGAFGNKVTLKWSSRAQRNQEKVKVEPLSLTQEVRG